MLRAIQQSGFSLVELLIAITVMGILMAYGAPTYQSWMQNTQIRTAAESVQNGLQLARAEAARRNANVSFILNGNNWSVNVLALGVAGDAFYTPAATVQQKNGTEGTRNAVIAATQNPITFNGLGRITPAPASSVSISVTNTTGPCATAAAPGNLRCLNVMVEPGGQIKMCDPMLNGSGNPQACTP